MSLETKLGVNIVASLTGSHALGTKSLSTSVSKTLEFKDGTANTGQANLFYGDVRTLAASATENLDLNGTLLDPLGGTFNAAEIVLIYIEASASNTNDVVVGGAASNTFIGPFADASDKLVLKPGEFIALNSKAGWPVTATTADLLKIANSAGSTSVKYTVMIVGRTVAV